MPRRQTCLVVLISLALLVVGVVPTGGFVSGGDVSSVATDTAAVEANGLAKSDGPVKPVTRPPEPKSNESFPLSTSGKAGRPDEPGKNVSTTNPPANRGPSDDPRPKTNPTPGNRSVGKQPADVPRQGQVNRSETEPPSLNKNAGRNGQFRGNNHTNATVRRGPPAHANQNGTVNVSVRNARANEAVSLNVSNTARRNESVVFDTLDLTPTTNESFTLNATASEQAIPDKTPALDLSNGTEPLAYLSVDHSISDSNIQNVTFTFRIRKDRVNASERNEIALYRFHDETWNELPTTLVETTEDHYVYRVQSPGLSEFAAGKKTTRFEITNATVEVDTLTVGDSLTVRLRIQNRGDADGTFTASLALDDEILSERKLTIAGGGTRQLTFDRTVSTAGVYDVYVNDLRVGEVAINDSVVGDDSGTSETGSQTRSETESDEKADGASNDRRASTEVPGFGLGSALGALLVALLVASKLREKET
ncbi:PGF-pre-PGF domain-containing protein [Halorussus halophilus]|uniref:PGF-pre-PGF domain-containing protein n=1 Tax=Halorussus halophilus TaxID=2650975 RepID=UPI00178804D6|nr:PGF-pre-PGF domain-containing protein [Halorussus halophilus]